MSQIKFSSLREIDALFPHQLREAIKEELNAPKTRILTMGLLLWRMKKEKLFLLWGYKKISQYYLTEIMTPVSRAEMWVAFARRCLSHKLSFADMQSVELLVPDYGRMGRLTGYARNRQELLRTARIIASGAMSPRALKHRLNGYTSKPVRAFDIGDRPLDYEVVHLVNNWLKKKLRRPGHSLLVPFLVVKAIHESKPGKRWKYFQRLLLRHGIPEEFVPVIFQKEE